MDVAFGYWPSTIFTNLANNASRIQWGGVVGDSTLGGSHTTTQMGSGHFPFEGFGKSSYFRNLKVIDSSDTKRDPVNLEQLVSAPTYYDLKLDPDTSSSFGTHFYYGGSGLPPSSH